MTPPPAAPVVGAAILRAGRVLAARRTSPPRAAGRWELPGGKVEPGETPQGALVREVAEELGCAIEVTGWLPGAAPIGETHVLTVATAVLREGSPEPGPAEHDEVRWLGADELGSVDWLEPDRPFLEPLADVLRRDRSGTTDTMRAIFFEEDDAVAVAARLRTAGFEAHVERERLAGEDDDEGHPWAVLSDAPGLMVELLVDEYDGWLDVEPPETREVAPVRPPLDLPSAPRRLKRPD